MSRNAMTIAKRSNLEPETTGAYRHNARVERAHLPSTTRFVPSLAEVLRCLGSHKPSWTWLSDLSSQVFESVFASAWRIPCVMRPQLARCYRIEPRGSIGQPSR